MQEGRPPLWCPRHVTRKPSCGHHLHVPVAVPTRRLQWASVDARVHARQDSTKRGRQRRGIGSSGAILSLARRPSAGWPPVDYVPVMERLAAGQPSTQLIDWRSMTMTWRLMVEQPASRMVAEQGFWRWLRPGKEGTNSNKKNSDKLDLHTRSCSYKYTYSMSLSDQNTIIELKTLRLMVGQSASRPISEQEVTGPLTVRVLHAQLQPSPNNKYYITACYVHVTVKINWDDRQKQLKYVQWYLIATTAKTTKLKVQREQLNPMHALNQKMDPNWSKAYSWIAPPVDAHEKSICQQIKRVTYGKSGTMYGDFSARRIHIHLLQLDWASNTSRQRINLPANQKGYDTFETTVGKLSARRIQIFRVYLFRHYFESYIEYISK